jgi:hypothetical protein
MAVYGRNMCWGRKVTDNKLHWRRKYIIWNKWYINATGCLIQNCRLHSEEPSVTWTRRWKLSHGAGVETQLGCQQHRHRGHCATDTMPLITTARSKASAFGVSRLLQHLMCYLSQRKGNDVSRKCLLKRTAFLPLPFKRKLNLCPVYSLASSLLTSQWSDRRAGSPVCDAVQLADSLKFRGMYLLHLQGRRR